MSFDNPIGCVRGNIATLLGCSDMDVMRFRKSRCLRQPTSKSMYTPYRTAWNSVL